MAPYDLQLAPSTVAAARRDGFDPTADVVPSALGVPVSTGLSPEDYEDYVERLLDIACADEHFVVPDTGS
jgi:hypothetical protein